MFVGLSYYELKIICKICRQQSKVLYSFLTFYITYNRNRQAASTEW